MPRLPIDYSKTQIYKLKHIEDYNDENVYVGHTTNWINRKNQHKTDCNLISGKTYNEKKYISIRENGGWEEWDMYLIEDYPCNNNREAEAREEYWRSFFNANLNMIRAFRTKEEGIEYNNKYYEQNKDRMIEQAKENYKKNKDKKLTQAKENYEENKDSKIAYQKEYYEKNKEEIKEQHKQKITCKCGFITDKGHLSRHLKTKRHNDNIYI